VLSMLAKLGKKTCFIGKVGDDMFGHMLEKTVKDAGISTEGLKFSRSADTTLAFVRTLEGGDREFSFYRNPGADVMLEPADIDEALIQDSKIFHFGTLSMTDEPARSATLKALETAIASGAVISFDPNIREPLWKSMDDARVQTEYALTKCQILKISDNEITWLAQESDYDKGIKKIQEKYNIPLILLTMGADGSKAYQKDMTVMVPGFVNPNTIETTGAGDSFMGCTLNYVLEHGFREYSEDELTELLRFANGAASLVTTRKGALKSMPSGEEVETYISEKD